MRPTSTTTIDSHIAPDRAHEAADFAAFAEIHGIPPLSVLDVSRLRFVAGLPQDVHHRFHAEQESFVDRFILARGDSLKMLNDGVGEQSLEALYRRKLFITKYAALGQSDEGSVIGGLVERHHHAVREIKPRHHLIERFAKVRDFLEQLLFRHRGSPVGIPSACGESAASSNAAAGLEPGWILVALAGGLVVFAIKGLGL